MDNIPHEILQQANFVGPRFTGVFFFQNVFWRVTIPVVFGARAVDALAALTVMPQETKQRLATQADVLRQYLLLWADCVDYDIGFGQSKAIAPPGSFLSEMVNSTERELTSAIGDLCQQRPNSKAMHTCREAMEKALKAYLAHHANLTRDRAKNHFSHKLDKLTREVADHTPQSPLVELGKHLNEFAPYEDRYTSATYTWPRLWSVYRLTQFAAGEMVRSITGCNHRAQVESRTGFGGFI
jgi:hypothetical protein